MRALATAPPAARVKILEMLGQRGDPAALTAVRSALQDGDVEVKFAAIQAAARLVGQSPGPALAAAIQSAAGAERVRLLSLATRVRGRAVLDQVALDARHASADVRGAALRTLASWPEPNAAPKLLELARGAEDDGERGIAIEGYMRLVRAARYAPERMLEIYKSALAAARRSGEKRMVLDGLANLKLAGSLELILALFADPELKKDAARAAVECALPRKSGRGGLTGPATKQALKMVLPAVDDAELAKAARDYLTTL
jgi:hypothetical protein